MRERQCIQELVTADGDVRPPLWMEMTEDKCFRCAKTDFNFVLADLWAATEQAREDAWTRFRASSHSVEATAAWRQACSNVVSFEWRLSWAWRSFRKSRQLLTADGTVRPPLVMETTEDECYNCATTDFDFRLVDQWAAADQAKKVAWTRFRSSSRSVEAAADWRQACSNFMWAEWRSSWLRQAFRETYAMKLYEHARNQLEAETGL
ncbi:MAG: hypothetical protein M1826_005553 [Phylliscum demangeonii]|nr:MAG: hypothetical protein M1826_005553 [Phylliscum demangeonii]